MASITEIMEVKKYFTQQHIIVSHEWIEACINFVKEEQGHSITLQNLMKNVHQQWLVADLEEISCASLPHDLPTVQKIILNNCFALQVQGIRDISRPAYSQLKQLEGTVNSNSEFSSAPQASIPEWEAKPTRMLMLNLTDGCVHVQGMEYKTINFLSPNFPPGIKVLIKGPVECRFGVLLLTSDNIHILGGEVQSKLQQFSRETLLKQQLQLPINEDIQESETVSNQISNNQESTNNYTSSNVSQSHHGTQRSQTNHGIQRNQTNLGTQRNQTNLGIQRNQTNHPTSSILSHVHCRNMITNQQAAEDILDDFEGDDDDFVQNLDYGKIDEIENSQIQVAGPNNQDPDDIWEEDEDVVREMMEFQYRNPVVEMPFEMNDDLIDERTQDNQTRDVFTYLSTVTDDATSNCVITIKGFIVTVLSKLECTPTKGWGLIVKINDGTATVDATIHDQVLEGIIGVSAQEMIKKQTLAAQNLEVRKEVMEAISKCKQTLQNYNCLMDVKFTPGEKPCIVKCSPVSELQIKQLLERVSTGL